MSCHEYTREPLNGLVDAVLAAGQSQQISAPTLLLKDGTMLPIEISLAPIRAKNASNWWGRGGLPRPEPVA